MALAAGADDVGFVAPRRSRASLASARRFSRPFPSRRALVSFVMKMNRDNVRSPARSAANVEFHRVGDETDAVSHRLTRALEEMGARAAYPAMAFPMEATRWPARMWIVAHKPIAVAAGLGRMGMHRNVIHPKFGNFILLGTVVVDLELDSYSRPLDFNPCLECKLCVAACPTGAIAPDGAFDFAACYTHNYREFMGGFTDWVETIADAKSARAYRAKVSDAETVSMWQSLAYGPNYKAAYCMAVCPAGEDVISAYRDDRKGFLQEIVDPLRHKEETIYVTAGSDAEDYVKRRFPHKRVKRVGNGLRVASIASLRARVVAALSEEARGGARGRLSFRLHRRGAARSHRGDRPRPAQRRRGADRQGRSAHPRRSAGMAALPAQGDRACSGRSRACKITAARRSAPARRLRPVFSVSAGVFPSANVFSPSPPAIGYETFMRR